MNKMWTWMNTSLKCAAQDVLFFGAEDKVYGNGLRYGSMQLSGGLAYTLRPVGEYMKLDWNKETAIYGTAPYNVIQLFNNIFYLWTTYQVTAIYYCRSDWPGTLMNELIPLAQTLVSLVRSPLEAWTSVRVYFLFTLSCVYAAVFCRPDPLSKELYRLCITSKSLISDQGSTMGCRPIDNNTIIKYECSNQVRTPRWEIPISDLVPPTDYWLKTSSV
jgi:hypothetical protein